MGGEKAYLILQNGAVFEGRSFGAVTGEPVTGEPITGEVVFNTGMTGYLETLTDKSYYGQIVAQTFPLIGNYGVIPPDFEGQTVIPRAYIVHSWCDSPSNFRSGGDLDAFFRERGVPGICGIDTRALTRMIRKGGVMNGVVTYDKARADMAAVAAYRVTNAVEAVTCPAPYAVTRTGNKRRIALMDFGLKEGIKRELAARNCDVYVFPAHCGAEEITAVKPDGIMLSNGPGDPADNAGIIAVLRRLCAMNIPMFGICLGHQLLALAHGFRTGKLKFGHRGANQPVRDETTGKAYITSQNHGYAVLTDSVDPRIARALFTNINDGSNEGLEYLGAPIFSAQFHPEACPGPRDTAFLFDRFISITEEARKVCR
jgi:carbamoyl-phosphate synthase small subunit